jgi:hypothetical protein
MAIEDEELVRVSNEISVRLKHLCSHMTELDFAAMVRSIAENQLRAQKRPAWKGLREE